MIVILDKDSHLTLVENISVAKKLTNLFKSPKSMNAISEGTYNKVRPVVLLKHLMNQLKWLNPCTY